ncbi:MAG: hypothetical protein EXR75_03185 [Myxococcales bacterium]|nr:hypothetical protein [Myxococcales bacterium]
MSIFRSLHSRRFVTLTVVSGLAALATTGACSSKDEAPATTASTGAGSCAPQDPACPALAIESECLALVDNAGADKFTLRLSQLSITKPQALTTVTVQKIVSDGVNINLPACNVPGTGTFSLLTEFDLAAGTFRTGGALPEADPKGGYCYAYDDKLGVEPADAKLTIDADLRFSTAAIDRIVVPIYLDLAATSAVYLPLRNAVLKDGQLSPDHNCIGKFNAAGLEPVNNCLPDTDAGIDYFINGGKLEGHITLEEADAVTVELLAQSLCVLLSGDPATYGDGQKPNKCKRDGAAKITLVGDWCSTTDSAGGCKDAFQLSAELAGSAAKLRDNCVVPGGGTGGAGGAG